MTHYDMPSFAEQNPKALKDDVIDHPSATTNSASVDRLQVEKWQIVRPSGG